MARTLFKIHALSCVLITLTAMTFPVAAQTNGNVSPGGEVDTSADPYPHISALEKAILGTTHPKEALDPRLARMETKAFGAPVKGQGLADRSDALEDWASKNLKVHFPDATVDDNLTYGHQGDGDASSSKKYGSATSNDVADNGSDSSTASADQGDYPHVTALEKAILGAAFKGEPLSDRLSRMEVKAFGKANTTAELADRTDALELYAEKTLHKETIPGGSNIANDSGEGGGASDHKHSGIDKIASTLGQAVMGMAGVGYLGPTGIPGFGGVRVRPKPQTQQDLPLDDSETPPEDPMINSKTPPPSDAKFITQVGWCEQHVFGHTFPTLHLTARLTQLNKELNVKPNASGMELMDDMPQMIKLTQARLQKTM